MRNLLHQFYLFILLACSVGCHSATDLLSEKQPIPYLSQADSEIIEIVDNADPFEEIGQRIIWKVDKKDGIPVKTIVLKGQQNLFGGLILNGYTIEEYNHIRSQLDSVVIHPLIYGTEEPIILNNQFSENGDHIPTIMLAALCDEEYSFELEDFLYDQMGVLGFNLASNLHVNPYTTGQNNWHDYFDHREDGTLLYQKRVSELNKRKTLTAYNSFAQGIHLPTDTIAGFQVGHDELISLIQNGLSAIILDIDLVEKEGDKIQTFFREVLQFNGLLISNLNNPEAVNQAVDAGIDMYIFHGADLDQFYDRFESEFANRLLLRDEVYEGHRKLLLAKYWMNSNRPANLTDYDSWMEIPGEERIEENSTTLVNNYKNLLPLTHTYKRDIRLLSYGPGTLDSMETIMRLFADHKRNFYNTSFQDILPTFELSRYRFATTIVTLDSLEISPQEDSVFIGFINDMSLTRKVALINFGNPENLIPFDTAVTKIQIYKRSGRTEALAAHLLYGGAVAQGKLPVTLSDRLIKGMYADVPKTRWKYENGSHIGIDQSELNKIERVAKEGIRRKAFPGCQVFAVKDGHVIYNKAFGKQSYRDKKRLKESDIYDIASVTKVASTTLSVMRLLEKGWLNLDDPLSKHLSLHDTLDISRIRIKDLLTHRSGIQANMPTRFIIKHKDSGSPDCGHYKCDTKTENYTLPVADKIYYSQATKDSLWSHASALSTEKGKYVYSDVNFYLLQKVIEKLTKKHLDTYVHREFYRPLGLRTCTYLPLRRFKKERIVPTEQDKKWRSQMLKGYVHDPTAALLGGISGNAGLFSNAHDMAVIGQMLLNNGQYGGRRYFKKETVELFTKPKFSKNRGLGFDSNRNGTAKVGKKASRSTYGHLGFTGTCLWIDPEEKLVYVFLSNRIHPNQKNYKISKYRYRQRIHDLIYSAIDKGKERVEHNLEIRAAKASFVPTDQ
ncbi:MAG: serine hydrolase [Bacteroidia bacterium]|nr:serine hydrolase [Bacteroidia bacterium]